MVYGGDTRGARLMKQRLGLASDRDRPYDVVTYGIPQSEAAAKRAGLSWAWCQKAQARQDAVAACRRRGAQKLLSSKRRYAASSSRKGAS
jgi:hypothetical protein